MTVQSALGQPLRAEIELLSVTKEELNAVNAKLASAEAFRQARLDRMESLSGLRFVVEQRPNGQPIVRVTSSNPINDPFLDLLIELSWSSGRLMREYTLLLDPPAQPKPAAAASVAAPAVAAVPSAKPAPEKTAEKPADKSGEKPAEAAKPAPKEYGPVKGGETLRSIAAKVKPEAATLEQMMVALYQANKSAFMDGNMNRLKKGKVLRVPGTEEVMVSSYPSQASKIVGTHAREWHAAREQAAEVPARDKAAASGKIEAAKAPEQPAPAVSAKDVLKLSKGEPVAGKPDPKAAARMQAVEEELAAKSRALKESEDRIAQLERTVRDMQRLLELKAKEAAAPKPEAPEVEAPKPEAPKVEAPKVEAPAKPVAKPAAPPPAPAPQPEPSLLDTVLANPTYLGGGVAGLLLITLLGLMASKRRKAAAAPEKVETPVASAISVPASIPPESLPTGMLGQGPSSVAPTTQAPRAAESSILTDFSRLGLGSIDTQEIDPIAEAEVYLAYGRDAQAEEILREALGKMPGREDILLKLLEIYHARKDAGTFEATARELQAALNGESNATWEKAAAMGRELDPPNPLYQAQSGGATAVAAAATGVAAAAVESQAADLEFPAEPEPAHPEAVEDLDFEFDMGLSETPPEPTPEPEPEPVPEPTPAPVAEPEPEAMDLDFALPEEEVPAPVEDLDFDLELPTEPKPEPAATAEAEAGLDLGEGLDFGFESVAPAVEEPVEAPAADEPIEAPAAEPVEPEADLSLADLDFSGIDLDLTDTPAEPSAEAPDLDLGMPEMEALIAGEEEAAPAAETELSAEVNAKLDLARAYLEMGDREGAREILQEVMAEGNSEQKAEANQMLAEAG